MKKLTLFLLLAAAFACQAQTQQQIDNVSTFAKLYGYVRYFHPSDEAAGIDWNRFAIYGTKKVAPCSNQAELKATLTELFSPIAPTLQIGDDKQPVVFNKSKLLPPSPQLYKTIAWQHIGVGLLNDKRSPYQSARTNRTIVYTPISHHTIAINKTLDVNAYRGRPFKFKARAKMVAGTGSGDLTIGIYRADAKNRVWYGSTANDPIDNPDWQNFEVAGIIDTGADKMYANIFFEGNGDWAIDDVSITVKSDTGWVNLFANSFNDKRTGEVNAGLLSGLPFKTNKYYKFSVVEDAQAPGQKWASVQSRELYADSNKVVHNEFFKESPQVGQYISKDIGSGLKIILPIALYGDSLHTYPVGNAAKLSQLTAQLKAIKSNTITGDDLYTRLADVVITWNVMQHFFPYFDFAKTDWQQDMRNALTTAYTDKNSNDFLNTLQKLTARLKDGHVKVYRPNSTQNGYRPPIVWEWVQGKLVITDVLDKAIKLKKGTVVTSVNGLSAEAFFKNAGQYISAATPGWLNYRAKIETLEGDKDTELKLSTLNENGKAGSITLQRNLTANAYYKALPEEDSIKHIGKDIIYLNISVAGMDAINRAMPQLQNCKAIICDLRGYPNDNTDFINHLLTQNDTAKWMQTPHIIYPDQEKPITYETEGWGLKPMQPHLTAKIIFLINGEAISYAESYMGIISHYKLATIIGQPTAGTNGDTNLLSLPGGYNTFFTGLIVTQLDGSPQHGMGTKPDIYVEKTIKGVREGRDEFLEKAIAIADQ